MNYELLEALNQIAREKNVDREVLIETLMAGLLQAARRKYGLSAHIDMRFDRDRGLIEAHLIRRVVGQVEDAGQEIRLEEARELRSDAAIGEEIRQDLDVSEFGRSAASAAKHVLVQRVREAERDRIYEEFHGREGELMRGVVQQVDRRNVLVRVDGVEAILPEREALHRDRFRQGDHITSMLLEVDRLARGPQVILTRSHSDFLRRLFENEVPEISEKIVEIRSIAREAGARAKVGVYSHDDRVDAVGACVGVKGSRVQNIVRELGGERIDIVPWSSDAALFVTRALSPARVVRVDVDEDAGAVTVVVGDDQLSLAIGKGGQNVRLAMKLTGWSINLVSEAELLGPASLEDAADFDLEDIAESLGPKLTEKLIQAGLETARDVINADEERLLEIEGVGPKIAEKVRTTVSEMYDGRLEAARAEREHHPVAAAAGGEVDLDALLSKTETTTDAETTAELPAEEPLEAPVADDAPGSEDVPDPGSEAMGEPPAAEERDADAIEGAEVVDEAPHSEDGEGDPERTSGAAPAKDSAT
jgi:N utilization substance protein A